MSERKHDYVPRNAAQFNAFMENLLEYVEKHAAVWRHIPDDAVLNLKTLFAKFQVAFQATLGPHTSAQNLARNEAQAAATAALRPFVNQYLRFPPITNVDRVEMGVPNHDTIRTDHTVVTETVDYVIHLRNIRELAVEFWQSGQTHKAKPDGYDGAVIVWDVLDAPASPAHTIGPDSLTHHTMASRTPFTLHFEETQRGKTVYLALAWQNERGILGAWSEIKSAIIP